MKLLSMTLLLVAMATSCSDLVLPLDCQDVHDGGTGRPSGVYAIYPIGATSAVQVYCDMDALGGHWTVFQRRMDGSVNFYRGWDQYKTGFGNAAGEYWLGGGTCAKISNADYQTLEDLQPLVVGLESLYHLTQRKKYELLVDMADFEGNQSYALYSSFSVGPESDGYRLNLSGFGGGEAGDSVSGLSGQKFSTFDKDQDIWEKNCARSFIGAFWYSNCHSANPNGVYRWGSDASLYAIGVEWTSWKGRDYSLKAISMKIRSVQ